MRLAIRLKNKSWWTLYEAHIDIDKSKLVHHKSLVQAKIDNDNPLHIFQCINCGKGDWWFSKNTATHRLNQHSCQNPSHEKRGLYNVKFLGAAELTRLRVAQGDI